MACRRYAMIFDTVPTALYYFFCFICYRYPVPKGAVILLSTLDFINKRSLVIFNVLVYKDDFILVTLENNVLVERSRASFDPFRRTMCGMFHCIERSEFDFWSVRSTYRSDGTERPYYIILLPTCRTVGTNHFSVPVPGAEFWL